MSVQKRSALPLGRRVERPTIDDLRNLELFHGLKNETFHFICQDSLIYEVDANQRLDTTRDRINYLYVILDGYLTAWRPSCFDPGKEYFLAWRGPNQIIGEMRAIGTEPNSTRFQTCDPCHLLEIPSNTFINAAASDLLIYRNFSNLLMKKMRYQGHRAEVVQMANTRLKVVQTLLHLAEDRCGSEAFKNQDHLHIPGLLNQTELGLYADIDRSTVNRELNELKKEELIYFSGSKSGTRIVILRRSNLEKITQTHHAASRRNQKSRAPEF